MYNKYMKLLAIISIIALAFAGVVMLTVVRWDHVPIVEGFVLGIRQIFGVDASRFEQPITWDQLDEKPDVDPEIWDDSRDGYWFDHINPYTIRLLQRYMRKNSLAIVPGNYVVETTNRLEELLEILEFVPIEE